jgi:hypothetical protein
VKERSAGTSPSILAPCFYQIFLNLSEVVDGFYKVNILKNLTPTFLQLKLNYEIAAITFVTVTHFQRARTGS